MVIRRAIALVALCLLVLPAGARAHAVLERTEPSQGAQLERPPDQIAFYFNEPVEASFGAVRVFNSQGEEVQSGDLLRPGDSSEAIGVGLDPDLADGTYTATYRVISADAHPVSGGFVFSIGSGGGSGKTVAELLEGQSAGAVTETAFWADRLVGYAALGAGIGLLVFLVVVWLPALATAAGRSETWRTASEAFQHRWRALIWIAIGSGLAATLLALPLQGATAAGTSFWSALDPDVLGEVLETRFGEVMALRAAAWVGLAAVVAVALSPRRTAGVPRLATLALGAVPLGLLAITPALSGHASTQDPGLVLFPMDVIHVTAMSVWLGGLLALVLALPAATARLDGAERSGLLVGNLTRFSVLALCSVLALAVTGTVQALIEVGSIPGMVETGFGRLVLVKVALFVGLVALGWSNRARLVPELSRLAGAGETPGRTGIGLRRNLRLEVGLIAAVLAATALLVSYAPPSDSSGGPVSGRIVIGPNLLEYTVEPARVGRNEVHLYLFDAEDGSQFAGAEEVSASAILEEKDIGPLELELEKAGPGHYVAPNAPLGVPGDWTLSVAVRTSRFDSNQAVLEVPVE
jgi:copper transport protein